MTSFSLFSYSEARASSRTRPRASSQGGMYRSRRRRDAARSLGALAGCVALLGSTGPAASAEEARSADAFVDSIGVNVHTSYNDTAYRRHDLIRQKLVDLGVRHVRDGLVIGRPDQYRALNDLAGAGIQSNLILGDPRGRYGTGSLNQQLTTLETEVSGAVASVEGPNEYDLSGDSNWAPAVRDYQARLYAGIKSKPTLSHLPVVGPSLVHRGSRGTLGDLTESLDFGNIHSYPGGRPPEWNLDDQFTMAASNSGSQPLFATETGYHNAVETTNGHVPASEEAAAAYLPRLFLEYFRRGVVRTFSYELLDLKPFTNATNPEHHFGLLRNDFSEKPAFKALKRLIDLLEDPGGTFTPGSLGYSVAGGSGVRHLLLEKRDGSFYVVIWRSVSVWDWGARRDSAPAAQPVSLDFEEPVARAEVFRPGEGSAPIATQADTERVALEVPGDALVVKVVPASSDDHEEPPPPPDDRTPAPPEPEPNPDSAPTPTCMGLEATRVGTAGGDVLRGTPRSDVIVAGGGNDHVTGLGGRDVICGGAGADRIRGGAAHDTLVGATGHDRLFGEGNRDRLLGGGGRDTLYGGASPDRLHGGPRFDRCYVDRRDRMKRSCEVRRSAASRHGRGRRR